MVTDRVSTAGLLVCLSLFYPNMAFVFQFLIVLDISSHWIQVCEWVCLCVCGCVCEFVCVCVGLADLKT